MSDVTNSEDQDRYSEMAALRQRRAPSALVNAAKMLALNPRPTAARLDEWQAECPGTSHQLTMWPEEGRWVCSQCSYGGDVDALEHVWRRRRSHAA